MNLTAEQIAFFHENGYLKIEDYLSDNEIETLLTEFPKTVEENSERIILEANGSIRSVFAPHFTNAIFEQLGKLERFVVPIEQLLNNKVYIHQYKINVKKGLKSERWEWHQDFPYWHIDDSIEKPELITAMIYLQDTDSINGALLVIPKTHKLGIVKFAEKSRIFEQADNDYSSSLSADIKFTIDPGLLEELALKNGILALGGKKGTVLFFHGNIFHASNNNMTPFNRDVVLITYNSICNTPVKTSNFRPEYLANRNYSPVISNGNVL